IASVNNVAEQPLTTEEPCMKTELLYLVYVTAFTGLLWVPYILDRIVGRGLGDAVGYPENPKPQSPWAQRLVKAHANAVENLVTRFPAKTLTQSTVYRANRPGSRPISDQAGRTRRDAWSGPARRRT